MRFSIQQSCRLSQSALIYIYTFGERNQKPYPEKNIVRTYIQKYQIFLESLQSSEPICFQCMPFRFVCRVGENCFFIVKYKITVIIIQTQSKEKAQSTSSPLVGFVLNWMFGVKMPFLSCRFCLNIYFYQTTGNYRFSTV